MIDNNSKNNKLDDRQLSLLMKKELPAAPANPWFTRKVMNRLPAKGPHIYSWIEYGLCNSISGADSVLVHFL